MQFACLYRQSVKSFTYIYLIYYTHIDRNILACNIIRAENI